MDVEGGRAGSAPSLLGNGLTPLLTVVLTNGKVFSFYCKTWYRIFKMIPTSGFLTALECTKFVFGWCSVPDLTGVAYSAPPEPLAGLRGFTSKGEGNGGREKRRGKGKGGCPPPFCKFLDPPLLIAADVPVVHYLQ